MLELKPKNNVGRLCEHCGYIRSEDDKTSTQLCTSCNTRYGNKTNTNKTNRQTRGNSELFNSCMAEKQNKQAGIVTRSKPRVNTKARYARNDSTITASSLLTWLGLSVVGVISAIVIKSYIGM